MILLGVWLSLAVWSEVTVNSVSFVCLTNYYMCCWGCVCVHACALLLTEPCFSVVLVFWCVVQVSALAWNKDHRQLISAHGQPRNHMMVWQYPTLRKVRQLSGHSDRILHMCLSPRRGHVASAGTDETLRIWQCFERLQQDVSQCSYSEESILALLHSLH